MQTQIKATKLHVVDSPSRRWGVILAGGDGRRLLGRMRRVAGAGRRKAAQLANRRRAEIKLGGSGAGAAAIAGVEFFCSLGMARENVVLVDSKGVIHAGRKDLNRQKHKFATPDDARRTLAASPAAAPR